MKYTLFLIAAFGLSGLTTIFFKADTVAVASETIKPVKLVVHEWGTFTSIAGKNGVAIDWRPLNAPSDLPKFVYSQTKGDGFRGTYGVHGKGDIARVRMETPVIYFYTDKAMDVSVSVEFPKGNVTEWYPQASLVNTLYAPGKSGNFLNGRNASNGINWGTIKLLPDEKPDFMREVAYSHYYPARETDAVPIQVCNGDKTKIEKEKFLFYRGIGNFELPLTVRISNSKVILGTTQDKYLSKGNPGHEIGVAILFENQGGHIGYQLVPAVSENTTVERPSLNRSITDVYAELEKLLLAQGLYKKEVRAMIETWKDSWFEEGMRVFYILPRVTTDEVLPLTVEPNPTETVRVLVGRTEVITPEMKAEVSGQVSLLRSPVPQIRSGAAAALKKRGRFYEPILKDMLDTERNMGVRDQLKRLIAADNTN